MNNLKNLTLNLKQNNLSTEGINKIINSIFQIPHFLGLNLTITSYKLYYYNF